MPVSGKSGLLAFAVAFCLSSPTLGNPRDWPKLVLTDPAGSEICDQAFAVAKAQFLSDDFYLYAPPHIPEGLGSRLVLGANRLIDRGWTDGSIFTTIPKPDSNDYPVPNVYWEKKPTNGFRFVLAEDIIGWRGEHYSLFALSEDVTFEAFIADDKRRYYERVFVPIIGGTWQPPLIFRSNLDDLSWAMDITSLFLAPWEVFVAGPEGVVSPCLVEFGPGSKGGPFSANGEEEIELLPPAVRRLAHLLDGTLGTGLNEGTLNPTAHIRNRMGYTWANVALRPWAAVKAEPYNSREQVDEGLKKWSRQAPSFGAHYAKLLQQYPKAERALARYYEAEFDQSREQATETAKAVIDLAFRSNFVFRRPE